MEDLREILKRRLPSSNGRDHAPSGAGTSSSVGNEGVAQVPINGTREGGVIPDPVCPHCGGTGWQRRDVDINHPEFGKMFPCLCKQKKFDAERFGRFLRISNLGYLANVNFEALVHGPDGETVRPAFRQALAAARDYARDPQGWLVLVGPAGCGKTSLAAAIATEVMRNGSPVFFMSVADLLDHLRSAYAPGSEATYDEVAEQIKEIPLLVLDDLGSQSATPWAQEKLLQVLGARYNARKATVVTTDLPLESLEDRLRSRLQDATLVKVVEIGETLTAGRNIIEGLGLEDLAHMTFETFDPHGLNLRGPIADNLAEAKRLAYGFAQHPEGWLVLAGGYGCGKTHLATAIAHHRRQQGDSVLFIFVPDLLDYLRSTFNSESSSTYQVLDRVKRVPLLILDDFAEPAETGWTKEKLYQILNYRYLHRLPTVITSGIEPEMLEPRIWSRMNDSRLSTVYEILAPDYRTGVSHRARRPAPEADRPRSHGRPPRSIF